MRFTFGLSILPILLLGGCNTFSFMDKPSGDVQVLAAAQACFDQGDYTCASTYYSQLSSAYSDQQNSETAFLLLAQNGVPVSVFMDAVLSGSTSGGVFITKLANALSRTAGATQRLGIFHAYQKNAAITDSRTRGLIKFITSAALAAEVLAEGATTPGRFAKSDLVSSPTTCAASLGTGYNSAACDAPTTRIESGSPITLSTATDAQISNQNSLYLLNAALTELDAGITLMQTTGSLGSSSSSFSLALSAAATAFPIGTTANDRRYRGTLLQFNVGEP